MCDIKCRYHPPAGSIAAIAFQLTRERLAAVAPVDSQQIRLTRISEPYSMPPARFQHQPVEKGG